MFNQNVNQENLDVGNDDNIAEDGVLSANDIHAMPDQYFQKNDQPKGKGKWIILGSGIFLILAGLIGGAVYFFSRQAPAANNQGVVNNQNQKVNQPENQNNNANGNQNVNTNVALDTFALRDMTRLTDIAAVRVALASYYQTFSSFPNSLSDLVERFLAKVPQNPTPGGQDYVYAVMSDRLDYSLTFALENGGVWGIAKLPEGVYVLTAEGLLPQSDSFNADANQNQNVNSNINAQPTPSFTPGDGLDTDGDGLSDIEENIYKTDSTLVDTDGDTFSDANEVLNFYNPTSKDGRLVDSGLISVYQSDVYKYSLLYPADWSARSLSDTEILFTSNTGEFVSITVQENLLSMSAYNWYLDKVPNVDISSLQNLTVDGIPAIQTSDSLNTYLSAGSKIFMITYNIGAQQQMNFKTTYQLFLKSFMFIDASLAN